MLKTKHKFATISAITLLAASMGVTNTIAQSYDEEMAHIGEPPVADAVVAGEFIDFSANVEFERAVVRISGPKDYAATIRVPAGTSTITADLLLDAEPALVEDLDLQAFAHDTDGRWHTLPDGQYRYELVLSSGDRTVGRIIGDFRVENGIASDDGLRSQGSTHNPTLLQRIAGAALDLLVPSAKAQSLNVNNQVLIDDTSENDRTHVRYENSSDQSGDWWRVGNIDGDFHWKKGFVTQSNPDSVMMLRDFASGGYLGMGTTTPSASLHIVREAGTAQIRMDNNSTSYRLMSGQSSGFTIAEISPTRTVFRIDPGAPSNSLRIRDTGNVGLGTFNADAALHVRRTDGTSEILVEETEFSEVNRQLQLRSNGNTGFVMQNSSNNRDWEFRTGGQGGSSNVFLINYAQQAGPELRLTASGNLVVKGTVSGGSSRESKTNISRIDANQAIEKLRNLELHEWSYAANPETRHIGPMAEDFYELFSYGDGPTQVAPSDLASLALMASQQLIQTNNDLENRVRYLEEKLQNN